MIPLTDIAEFEFLLREMHHRMANTLTLVAIGLRLELGLFRDPELLRALRAHEQHVVRLAELHRFFITACPDAETPAREYFLPLLDILDDGILAPFGIRCRSTVEDGVLTAAQCQWVGLLVAELVTNVAKHAFSGNGGEVRVEILNRGGYWCCRVSDNGQGMPKPGSSNPPRMIARLADFLCGIASANSSDKGTTVSVVFPQESAPTPLSLD